MEGVSMVSDEWLQQQFDHGNIPHDQVRPLIAEVQALRRDNRVLCNALQRIEVGEVEPRMIARRALEVPTARSGDCDAKG
jgi:hypothetical protein